MKPRMLLSLLLLLVLAAGAGTAMKIGPGQALAAGTPSPVATGTAPAGTVVSPLATASATGAATTAPLKAGTAVTNTTAVTTTAAALQTGTAFATINLEAGIPLDPFLISLQAGGTVDASTLSPTCKGYIPAAPSVTFTFNASPDLLKGFFYSDGDPVLVIQAPDGKYQCGDNTNPMLLDPTVQIDSPQPGRYNVWVGSAAPKDLIAGILALTTKPGVNVGNFRLGDLIKRPAIPEVLPTAPVDPTNRQKLEQGLTKLQARLPTFQAGDQPLTQSITAEGQLEAVQYMNGDLSCNGYIRLLPNFAFNFKGQTGSLHILFAGNHDATLIVRQPGPDGKFACNDDSAKGNLNAQVDIANPKEGTYAIWVGRTKTEVPVTGTLTITDAANAKLPVLTTR